MGTGLPDADAVSYIISLATLVLLAGLVGGCAATRPSTPQAVTRAYLAEISAGRAGSATLWLQTGLVAAEGPPAHIVARAETAKEHGRRAQWQLPGGRVLEVTGAGGEARIRAGVLALRTAATPAEALRQMSRALGNRDYDTLLRLMPESVRGHWSPGRLMAYVEAPAVAEAWRSLGAALEQVSGAALQMEGGKQARAVVGDVTVVLVHEQDGWKVLDVLPYDRYISAPER